jgi:hypothetical protein
MLNLAAMAHLNSRHTEFSCYMFLPLLLFMLSSTRRFRPGLSGNPQSFRSLLVLPLKSLRHSFTPGVQIGLHKVSLEAPASLFVSHRPSSIFSLTEVDAGETLPVFVELFLSLTLLDTTVRFPCCRSVCDIWRRIESRFETVKPLLVLLWSAFSFFLPSMEATGVSFNLAERNIWQSIIAWLRCDLGFLDANSSLCCIHHLIKTKIL